MITYVPGDGGGVWQRLDVPTLSLSIFHPPPFSPIQWGQLLPCWLQCLWWSASVIYPTCHHPILLQSHSASSLCIVSSHFWRIMMPCWFSYSPVLPPACASSLLFSDQCSADAIMAMFCPRMCLVSYPSQMMLCWCSQGSIPSPACMSSLLFSEWHLLMLLWPHSDSSLCVISFLSGCWIPTSTLMPMPMSTPTCNPLPPFTHSLLVPAPSNWLLEPEKWLHQGLNLWPLVIFQVL